MELRDLKVSITKCQMKYMCNPCPARTHRKHSYPPLLKSSLYITWLFTKDLPIFTNQKKSSGLHLLQCKMVKAKPCSVLLLQTKQGTQQWEWPPKLLPWELHSASQHQAARALNCVCEHLCFIWASVSQSCSKVTASSRDAIPDYKRFHTIALLSNSGGKHLY